MTPKDDGGVGRAGLVSRPWAAFIAGVGALGPEIIRSYSRRLGHRDRLEFLFRTRELEVEATKR